MFPAGPAGVGLLILRTSIAAKFLILAFPKGQAIAPPWEIAGLCVPAILLCLGAFTPAACACCVLIEVSTLPGMSGLDALHLSISILIATSLALLGPGAYSVDARLYGRRLVLPPVQ
ncbi:hypothetical protein [Granulicella sibirica]|uniref:Uncharacterized protein n=1 Tax=Granulicella sibirica TaxID=2479048 RepID=A0A4Q0T655_9BACT|nr:hypothetical protein [Granulicella sibirica]RXH57106.1 hypothetical protein GRAN_0416 [Granulicella sibirica]